MKQPKYSPESIRSREKLRRGEDHPMARADEEIVKDILSNTPLVTFPTLKYFIEKYNLPQSTASFIRSRRNWGHIKDPRTKCEHCQGKGFTIGQ